jgi:hypothetical protein
MLRRRPGGRRVPPRTVLRTADGALCDAATGETVTLADLRNDMQAGRYFRATRDDTGTDCTNEILSELIRDAVPDIPPVGVTQANPILRLLGAELFGGDDARS